MKKVFVVLISLLALIVACDPEQIATPLEDSRFNGNFHHYEHWEDENGIEESTRSIFWRFNGTNKAHRRTRAKAYFLGDGWTFLDYEYDYEIETKDNMYFRSKLWDNSYDTWSEWIQYEFLEDGSLRFHERLGAEDYKPY